MKYKSVIKRNEADANRTVAKISLVMLAVIAFSYILNLAGIFAIAMDRFTIISIVSVLLMIPPIILNKIVGTDNPKLKYIYIMLSALFLFTMISTLTYNAVIFYALPIAISELYFSKKLTFYTVALTFAVSIAGQFAGYYLNWQHDSNIDSFSSLIEYSIIPNFICLFCIASILGLLSRRTDKLIKEQQKETETVITLSADILMGFSTLVENRDESTGGHIKRTSMYAELIANELKKRGIYADRLTDEYIDYLRSAAPMHDIGKIAIPDAVLKKPGRLNDEEYEIMKTHAEKGGEIIKETFRHVGSVKFRQVAFDVARHHHEKWNGNGYPDRLKEYDIPLCARIMAIADVFDAISEKRCYREAMPLDECFKIIEDGKNRDFEPVLVDVFLDIRDDVERVRNEISACH